MAMLDKAKAVKEVANLVTPINENADNVNSLIENLTKNDEFLRKVAEKINNDADVVTANEEDDWTLLNDGAGETT